jgi:dTDP-4-amino-4,6-dideoxygalactose transaminase
MKNDFRSRPQNQRRIMPNSNNYLQIPFMDLKSQYVSLKTEIDSAVAQVISDGDFTLGYAVKDFERSFADYCGATYAVGVGSGTDALHFALLACDVEPGDEVITVPNTFIATVEAIKMCGARPVLVDVDRDTFLIDPGLLERAITSRTKAIVPVHLYGQPVDVKPILELCDDYGIKVVEDACQAHGAMVDGVKAGALGSAGCFSFYPTKNLGAIGDGGMVVTNDSEIKERVERFRNHGESGKHNHVVSGFCSRLHNIQAAVLNIKLTHLDDWNDARRKIAKVYDDFFINSPVEQPYVKSDRHHVYHLYVVKVERREQLQGHLKKRGIDTAIHYPVPVHLQPAFSYLGYKKSSFPIAESIAGKILSLPMYPSLTEEAAGALAYELLDFVFEDFRVA